MDIKILYQHSTTLMDCIVIFNHIINFKIEKKLKQIIVVKTFSLNVVSYLYETYIYFIIFAFNIQL